MNPGDKVWYKREHRGGYGYVRTYPAVVVKVTPKRVRIRLARVDRQSATTVPFERAVDPESLKPRRDTCSFERTLSLST